MPRAFIGSIDHRLQPVSHVFLLGAVAFSIAVAGLTLLLSFHVQRDLVDVRETSASMAHNLARIGNSSHGPNGVNFAAHLPTSLDPRLFIEHLQTSGTSNGVSLESVSTWVAPASSDKFGRSGFSVDLKGSYPQIKSVVAEALDRSPNLVLQSLSFKRRGQPAEVEAHVEFIALTRTIAMPSTASTKSVSIQSLPMGGASTHQLAAASLSTSAN